MRKSWIHDPHSGGQTVPPEVRARTERRIQAYAEANYAGTYIRIEVRFRGQFGYIDAYTEPWVPEDYDAKLYGESREERIERLRNSPLHMRRLRYLGNEERWSMAFYTYSNERYEPCFFNTGSMLATPEEAFETSAVYLTG